MWVFSPNKFTIKRYDFYIEIMLKMTKSQSLTSLGSFSGNVWNIFRLFATLLLLPSEEHCTVDNCDTKLLLLYQEVMWESFWIVSLNLFRLDFLENHIQVNLENHFLSGAFDHIFHSQKMSVRNRWKLWGKRQSVTPEFRIFYHIADRVVQPLWGYLISELYLVSSVVVFSAHKTLLLRYHWSVKGAWERLYCYM